MNKILKRLLTGVLTLARLSQNRQKGGEKL